MILIPFSFWWVSHSETARPCCLFRVLDITEDPKRKMATITALFAKQRERQAAQEAAATGTVKKPAQAKAKKAKGKAKKKMAKAKKAKGKGKAKKKMAKAKKAKGKGKAKKKMSAKERQHRKEMKAEASAAGTNRVHHGDLFVVSANFSGSDLYPHGHQITRVTASGSSVEYREVAFTVQHQGKYKTKIKFNQNKFISGTYSLARVTCSTHWGVFKEPTWTFSHSYAKMAVRKEWDQVFTARVGSDRDHARSAADWR